MTKRDLFDQPESTLDQNRYGQITMSITPAVNKNGGIYLWVEVEGGRIDGQQSDRRRESTYSYGLQNLTLNPIRSLAELYDFVDASFKYDDQKDIGKKLEGPKFWAKWKLGEWYDRIREDDDYWFDGGEREALIIWDNGTDADGNAIKTNPRVSRRSIEILDMYPNQAKTLEAYEQEFGALSPSADAEDVPF